jgi:hypothetical protein
MSKSAFVNKLELPDELSVKNIIGKAYSGWKILTDYLSGDLSLKNEWKFYGINYGWALRYTKSGRSVVALYPDIEMFTIQIILNQAQEANVISEITNVDLLNTIAKTESIHEGKWVYFSIRENYLLSDIYKLIQIRVTIK